jgi:hypothetical protein
LPHDDRISSDLTGKKTSAPRRRVRPGAYRVEIFAPEDAGRIAKKARAIGFNILSQEPRARVILVGTDGDRPASKKQLQDLSAVHGFGSSASALYRDRLTMSPPL